MTAKKSSKVSIDTQMRRQQRAKKEARQQAASKIVNVANRVGIGEISLLDAAEELATITGPARVTVKDPKLFGFPISDAPLPGLKSALFDEVRRSEAAMAEEQMRRREECVEQRPPQLVQSPPPAVPPLQVSLKALHEELVGCLELSVKLVDAVGGPPPKPSGEDCGPGLPGYAVQLGLLARDTKGLLESVLGRIYG